MLCNQAFPFQLENQEKYRTLNMFLIAYLQDFKVFHIIDVCILILQSIHIGFHFLFSMF